MYCMCQHTQQTLQCTVCVNTHTINITMYCMFQHTHNKHYNVLYVSTHTINITMYCMFQHTHNKHYKYYNVLYVCFNSNCHLLLQESLKRLMAWTFIHRHLHRNQNSSGLQCEVAYWPALAVGSAVQLAARQTHLCLSQLHYGLHPTMFSVRSHCAREYIWAMEWTMEWEKYSFFSIKAIKIRSWITSVLFPC